MRKFSIGVVLFAVATGFVFAEEIDWHEGPVESAFERAGVENKPLFLYWGAVWCPPCNQIKATIFRDRAFIDRSKLLVPVYLDGDTESAQTWGEKLQVVGYPTMLLMSPAGREVTRLPTGLQPAEFLLVLDQAIDLMTPVEQALDGALGAENGDAVSDQTYRLLAFYSWDQDRQLELNAEQQRQAFGQLDRQVPQRLAVERSRFFARWLSAVAQLESDSADGPGTRVLTRSQRRAADRRLRQILASDALSVANLEFLSYAAADLLELLYPSKKSRRRSLAAAWIAAMERLEQDESLSIDERVSTLFPAIAIHRLEQGAAAPLPDRLRLRVLERVAWADRTAVDAYNRQSAMNSAGYLLRRAGLTEEARKLYLSEIERSGSPYYFMSSLAALDQAEGDSDGAVAWMQRAYEASEGRATRFQWGARYLQGLLELKPDQTKAIHAASKRVLGELLEWDDAFAGRNQRRLDGLAAAYADWNDSSARAAEIATLRDGWLPACQRQDDGRVQDGESQRQRCIRFFESLGQAQ